MMICLTLPLSAVSGLLQARFTSGLLRSQLSENPRPSVSPHVAVEPPWPAHWTGSSPSTFLLPHVAPEPPIRTVGMRRLGGPVPLKESVTQGKVGALLLF